jgi:hypothetical protein
MRQEDINDLIGNSPEGRINRFSRDPEKSDLLSNLTAVITALRADNATLKAQLLAANARCEKMREFIEGKYHTCTHPALACMACRIAEALEDK